jgi:ABC-type transport system involved in multi-copper enzyme maturation permease subunit
MASRNAFTHLVYETRDWLTNRSALPERLIGLTFFASAATLVWLTLRIGSFWPAVIIWGLFFGALVVCTRQGWLKLLGPVLVYDMIRTARRNRYFILRMLYAGFLFFILAYMLIIAYVMEQAFMGPGGGREGLGTRHYALLAETFFMVFMLVQLTLVVLLTPAYVAGAIAEEKDRKTMEFMLATDLRDREIVLSKLLSRLANMSLLLLTGLPILSILQFIGGVDPQLMVAGFAAIALSMLGIGSLSILLSTLFKKPRDAISLTYLMLIAYGALATFLLSIAMTPLGSQALWFGDDPPAFIPTIGDISQVFNAGNPLAAIFVLGNAIGGRGGANLATVLPDVLERYAWFHLSVTAVCITWSILRLRAIALKQSVGGTAAKLRWWQRLRPAVGEWPMLWKELHIEGGTRLNWLVWIGVIILILLTLGTGLFIVGAVIYDFMKFGFRDFWQQMGEAMNVWFRIAGTFVACVLLLRTSVRAATSITSERERDTFDALVTTPMSAEQMLFAKFVGNLTGMWLGWAWFGSMLLLAVCTGGLHPLMLPILIGGCVVYSVVLTMVGLAFSMYCKSSLQASILSVLATLVLGGAHWIITGCFCMPAFAALVGLLQWQFNPGHELIDMLAEIGFYFIKFQAGVTPPFVFAYNSFSWRQLGDERMFMNRHSWELVGFSVLGLFLWAGAAALLWFFLLVPKFRSITRRIELEA